MVTADGELVRADEEENAELFWALRGGGGNLGIVTAFEFLAHRTTDVFHGRIAFPAAEAGAVLQGWAEYLRTASEDLTSVVAFANPFAGGPNAPVEVYAVVDTDDQEHADEVLAPIRRLGSVIADEVALKPYRDVLVDGLVPPPGIRLLSRTAYVERESVPEVLKTLAQIGAAEGSPVIAVRSVGAAVSRVADDATAYAHRSAELLVITTSAGPAPVLEATAPLREAMWARLTPHTVGAYANFQSGVAESDVSAVYPEKTYERVAAVKREYDPENLFRGNHNVKPL
ncbi:FAD-binding oxidoreductase [Catenulispora yoronensis]